MEGEELEEKLLFFVVNIKFLAQKSQKKVSNLHKRFYLNQSFHLTPF